MHGIVSRLLHSSLPLSKNVFYLFKKIGIIIVIAREYQYYNFIR